MWFIVTLAKNIKSIDIMLSENKLASSEIIRFIYVATNCLLRIAEHKMVNNSESELVLSQENAFDFKLCIAVFLSDTE